MRCQSTPELGSFTQTQEAQSFTLKDSRSEQGGALRADGRRRLRRVKDLWGPTLHCCLLAGTHCFGRKKKKKKTAGLAMFCSYEEINGTRK